MPWQKARVSNPGKKKMARRKTTRKRTTRRRLTKRAATRRRRTRRRNPGAKLFGVPVMKLATEAAMIAVGGFLSDETTQFLDDKILDPLGVSGAMRGIGQIVLVAGGLILGDKVNKQVKGIDITPGVIAMLAPVGASAVRGLLGIQQDVSAMGPAQAAVAAAQDVQGASFVSDAGYPELAGTMSGYDPQLDGHSYLDDMQGMYITEQDLGIQSPDHAHMQGRHMHGYAGTIASQDAQMQGYMDDGAQMQGDYLMSGMGGVNPAA